MDYMEKQLKLSKFLLEKYSDIINEREQRTIGEVKALVDGSDLTIQNFITQFKPEYYEFKKDYLTTLEKTFNQIINNIEYIKNDFVLNFWLDPKEILELKVADDEDLAVFLCNAMKALEDENAKVVIAEMTNLKTHAFVTTEIDKKILLLDPSQKHDFKVFFGDKVDVIMKYNFEDNKIKRFLYRFNSDKYEQFLEE